MASITQDSGSMIALGVVFVGIALVVGAVVTKPDSPSLLDTKVTTTLDSQLPDEPPAEPAAPTLTDEKWEAALKGYELAKTSGVVLRAIPNDEAARVDKAKWEALDESARRALGQDLAIYCGRLNGTEEYRVVVFEGDTEQALGRFSYEP